MLTRTVRRANEVAALYELGSSAREIARKLRVTEQAIYKYLKIAKCSVRRVLPPPARESRDPVSPGTRRLVIKMKRDGQTEREIGFALNVSRSTIQRISRESGCMKKGPCVH
jgi:DNA invertase Pin-like site-specific DNA recombinase